MWGCATEGFTEGRVSRWRYCGFGLEDEFVGERTALAAIEGLGVDTAEVIDASVYDEPALEGQGLSNLALWHSKEGEGDVLHGLPPDSTIGFSGKLVLTCTLPASTSDGTAGYGSVEVHVLNDGGHAGVQVGFALNVHTAYMCVHLKSRYMFHLPRRGRGRGSGGEHWPSWQRASC